MTHNKVQLIPLLIASAIAGMAEAQSIGNSNVKKPNILLVITDQQTADAMSCTGNKYLHTPAVVKLAATGEIR